ncbi:ATP synthase F1 subunit gamma [Candidatus Dojkabacteria bacterium]|nr:ATP synthase F1 subunit gamma [Candidatus Dojkabacteria bacterium]
MASLREIKSRIKAVKSTAKITKAMQMISASKMVKAQMRSNSAYPYAQSLSELIKDLDNLSDYSNPLLLQRPTKKIGILIIGSSRGFVGGMITALKVKIAEHITQLENEASNLEFSTITLHKEGLKISEQLDLRNDYHFAKFIDNPTSTNISAIKKVVCDSFINLQYDKIYIAYTYFKSVIKQEPTIEQLLPVPIDLKNSGDRNNKTFVYEPDVKTILDLLIPEYIENQIFSALLNSIASEYSARMVAMKSATDNANELNDKLSLYYNRTRQSNITKEITEIVSASKSKKKKLT